VNPSTIIHRSLIALIVVGAMVWSSTATADTKREQLRQTMADISLLNGQLGQRKTDADGIREALSTRLKAIKTEALRELQDKGIHSDAQALSNPRLFYDLRLMAEIQAYIDRYTQKIAYYRVACDRLSYLYQQADDDLKIVSTLSDLKIDALIAQVEKILNGYLPDAQTLVIQPNTLTIESPGKIWKALKTGG
jgi:hypothetical protein